jgi:heme/copper-type cytochrome/quinol oxidase subunit 2
MADDSDEKEKKEYGFTPALLGITVTMLIIVLGVIALILYNVYGNKGNAGPRIDYNYSSNI